MAITLTNSIIRDYVQHLGHPRPADGVLHLVGFRSASPYGAEGIAISIHEPAFDRFDDAVGYFGSDLEIYVSTVDPGATWTRRPPNPRGAAHLLGLEDGGKPYTYGFGLHKGRPALVQAGTVTVRRDRDRDGTAEAGEPVSTGWYGVNFHSGGRPLAVGAWSAGCQVLPQPQFKTFYDACKASGQSSFIYYLVDGKKFGTWFDTERP